MGWSGLSELQKKKTLFHLHSTLIGITPRLKIDTFCVLSQNNQSFFWKNYVCILKEIVKETKMALKL